MLCGNPTTQMVTRMLVLFLTTIALTSCGSGNSDNSASSPGTTPPVTGTTVQVSVEATDPEGDQLHYRWAATDGTISNIDAPNTTWVVPRGSGLQFAYVVVSDEKGGYTEHRAAALTFDPPTTTVPTSHISTPATSLENRGFVWGSLYSASFGRYVYLPNVTVALSNGSSAVTDMKGQFFIPNVQDGEYTATYQIPGRAAVSLGNSFPVSSSNLPRSPSAATSYLSRAADLSGLLQVAGSVRLKDSAFCGIRDELFTHASAPNLFRGPVSGTAQLLDSGGNPLSDPFPINHYGDFLILRGPVSPGLRAKVRITCETGILDVPELTLPAAGPVTPPLSVTFPNSRPTVAKMKVMLNGQDRGRPDLPEPTTLLPEMKLSPGDDTFLTYKGIDTRKSACAYYRAIGAVQGCDANGFPTGAQLTLAQWRSKFNLSPFPNGNPSNPPASDDQEVRIQYINRSDLNLGRDMQAIKLRNGDIAYNTCNYPGPQDVNDPLGAPKQIGKEEQADIDLAIDNARRGIGMVVCVAMDYSAIDGINGNQPFTKFYTFGPTGDLLLSVSLDGTREKFMPGICTNCHGGNAYGGQFPYVETNGELKSGHPDLQSFWQPFDLANLRFSSTQDLQQAWADIKELNFRMNLVPLTTPRTRELIGVDGVSGWYKAGGVDQDASFIPSQVLQQDKQFYQSIIQPTCQTCHAAQGTNSLSLNENFTDTTKICGGALVLEQNHTMPNALVPFERFWLGNGLPSLCTSGLKNHPPL